MLNDIESVNYEIFRGIAGKQCHWCHFTSINQKWTKILWGWFYLRRELFLTIKWGRLWVNKFFSLFNIYYMSNKNKKYVWCNLEKQNILTNNIFLKNHLWTTNVSNMQNWLTYSCWLVSFILTLLLSLSEAR